MAPEPPYSLAIYSSKAANTMNAKPSPESSPNEVSNTLSREQCHAARLARDARFDGRFFTGVLSTGIYCATSKAPQLPSSMGCDPACAAAPSWPPPPVAICRLNWLVCWRVSIAASWQTARSPNWPRRAVSVSAPCAASSRHTLAPHQNRWSRRAACCSRNDC